jgi:hypothetical protein
MKYTIEIADNEIDKIQTALDQENAQRDTEGQEAFKGIAEFIQHEVEERFGFDAQVESAARQDAIAGIIEQLRDIPTDKLADVATAVDTVAKPVDIGPAPVEDTEPLEP